MPRQKYLTKENNYPMRSSDILALFELKPMSPIPPHYTGNRIIDGVLVTITMPPKAGRRKHRVLARCPECKQDIPAGRLYQHAGTKACQEAAK